MPPPSLSTSARACARCARRWTSRCATSPTAAAYRRRCSPRSSGARPAPRCRRRPDRGRARAEPLPAAAPRRGRASPSCAPASAASAARGARPPLRDPDAAAARPARRAIAPHAGARRRHRRPRRPADARGRQPRDRRRHEGGSSARLRRRAPRAGDGDAVTFDADLPHHFENPGRGEARFMAVVAAGLEGRPDAQDDVREDLGGARGRTTSLLYIDLHLVHEVTCPQAFEGLRLAGRKVRRPDRTLATADHNVPTDGTPMALPHPRRALPRAGRGARAQLRRVRRPAVRLRAAARASCT